MATSLIRGYLFATFRSNDQPRMVLAGERTLPTQDGLM